MWGSSALRSLTSARKVKGQGRGLALRALRAGNRMLDPTATREGYGLHVSPPSIVACDEQFRRDHPSLNTPLCDVACDGGPP